VTERLLRTSFLQGTQTTLSMVLTACLARFTTSGHPIAESIEGYREPPTTGRLLVPPVACSGTKPGIELGEA